ncbi:hypothetical protein ECZU51_57180 [Escherichia coli]|nr:hypothetical protein ECZU51_57180 [Escherichia coli]
MQTFNPLTIGANIAPHLFAGDDMRVLLAPMEGVLDSLVRELLTEVNDYDLCITEFVRVVDQLLPVKVFHRICPELQNASRTPSGTLVRVQLLGQFPQWLAENAARAVELGSGAWISIAAARRKRSTAAVVGQRYSKILNSSTGCKSDARSCTGAFARQRESASGLGQR